MEKKLYFVSLDDIPEGKLHTDLTDEEFIELHHQCYDDIEDFVADFNEECAPSDVCNYCRYI